jgi:hypothetical protein
MEGSGDILTKRRRPMSKVKDLEKQIQDLSPEELTAFRAWFTKFDSDNSDQEVDADLEVDADVKGEKLDALDERSLREDNTGRITKL